MLTLYTNEMAPVLVPGDDRLRYPRVLGGSGDRGDPPATRGGDRGSRGRATAIIAAACDRLGAVIIALADAALRRITRTRRGL